MLQKIKLNNFQSHKKTEIDLNPNINIILGKSDSGKTAIIRAINWVINNRPSGDSFINNQSDKCEVEIIKDNKSIRKIKSKKDNSYFVEENELKAFGQSIPEEVTNFFNFSDLNIQKQLDEPFLLFKSGGDVSNYINSIIDLEIIEKSIDNINSIYRKNKKDFDTTKENIKDINEKITKYNYLGEFEKILKEIENKYNEYNIKNNYVDNLSDKNNIYIQLKNDIKLLRKKIRWEEDLKEIEDLDQKYRDKLENNNNLKSLYSNYSKNKQIFDEIKIDDNTIKDMDNLIKKSSLLDSKIKSLKDMIYSFDNYETYNRNVGVLNKDIFILEQELEKITPDICPLCEQKILKNI